MTTMLKAQYNERGPVPQAVIEAVPFDRPVLTPGQALVAVLAAPINPSDVLTLTGQYGLLPPLPAEAPVPAAVLMYACSTASREAHRADCLLSIPRSRAASSSAAAGRIPAAG